MKITAQDWQVTQTGNKIFSKRLSQPSHDDLYETEVVSIQKQFYYPGDNQGANSTSGETMTSMAGGHHTHQATQKLDVTKLKVLNSPSNNLLFRNLKNAYLVPPAKQLQQVPITTLSLQKLNQTEQKLIGRHRGQSMDLFEMVGNQSIHELVPQNTDKLRKKRVTSLSHQPSPLSINVAMQADDTAGHNHAPARSKLSKLQKPKLTERVTSLGFNLTATTSRDVNRIVETHKNRKLANDMFFCEAIDTASAQIGTKVKSKMTMTTQIEDNTFCKQSHKQSDQKSMVSRNGNFPSSVYDLTTAHAGAYVMDDGTQGTEEAGDIFSRKRFTLDQTHSSKFSDTKTSNAHHTLYNLHNTISSSLRCPTPSSSRMLLQPQQPQNPDQPQPPLKPAFVLIKQQLVQKLNRLSPSPIHHQSRPPTLASHYHDSDLPLSEQSADLRSYLSQQIAWHRQISKRAQSKIATLFDEVREDMNFQRQAQIKRQEILQQQKLSTSTFEQIFKRKRIQVDRQVNSLQRTAAIKVIHQEQASALAVEQEVQIVPSEVQKNFERLQEAFRNVGLDLCNLEIERAVYGHQLTFGQLVKLQDRDLSSTQLTQKASTSVQLSTKQSTSEVFWNSPTLQFLIQCSQSHETPLPILFTVYNRTLALSNYHLASGHLEALSVAAQWFDKFVNRLILDSCGVKDVSLARLLTSLVGEQHKFRGLQYRNNEIGSGSVTALHKLLRKEPPYQMHDLKLKNCKGVTPSLSLALVEQLAQKCYLRKLQLSGWMLSQKHALPLQKMLTESLTLIELDLSHNHLFGSKGFTVIAEQLAKNRTLKQLSFAGCPIFENNLNEESLQNFNEFIQRNQKLVHLDLRETSMSCEVLSTAIESIAKSKSLLSVHLCGNPGLTSNLFQDLAGEKLKLKSVKIPHLDWSTNLNHQTTEEAQRVKTILKRRRLETSFYRTETEQKFVVTRILGYAKDMPGSSNWQRDSQDRCWVCEKRMFSLIFWKAGHRFEHQQTLTNQQIQEQLQLKISSPIDNQNSQEQPPSILGEFNNWQGQKMLPLADYLQFKGPPCEQIEMEALFEDLLYDGSFVNQFPNCQSLKDCTPTVLERLENIKRDQLKVLYTNWTQDLMKCTDYKKPNLINASEVQHFDCDELYVQPVFLSPGKQHYLIQHFQNPGVQLLRTVVNYRDEDITPQVKQSLKTQRKLEFKRENTVFGTWREDSDMQTQKCFKHDNDLWKLSTFIHSERDLIDTKKLIQNNFYVYKTLYQYLASETAYPRVSQQGFVDLCTQCRVTDKKVGASHLEKLFNCSSSKVSQVFENSLCRYQFTEALVRVADAKYHQTGICSSVCEALQKLMTKHMGLNLQVRDVELSWRVKDLWTTDVNEILSKNMDSIQKIFSMNFTGLGRTKSKNISYDEAIKIMKHGSPPGDKNPLSYQTLLKCFGQSKMTIVNEKAILANILYLSLEFVEFLEMIGRCAQAKYVNSELKPLPLAKKIELFLGVILPPYGFTLKAVPDSGADNQTLMSDLSDY